MNSFLRRLDEHYRTIPDNIAVTDTKTGCRITYAGLDRLSAKVYAYLKARGIVAGDIVLVRLPRSAFSLVALVGIWKAGACCALFDDDYPDDYIQHIISECSPKLIVDETVWAQIEAEEPLPGRIATDPACFAFVAYTSGSTGAPKGVKHRYQTLDSIIADLFGTLCDTEVFGFHFPIYFVALYLFFCIILYIGKEFVLVDEDSRKDVVALADIFDRYHVTTTSMLPSLLKRFPGLARNMKKIIVCAEKTTDLFFPGIDLYNGYSQTETCHVLLYKIEHAHDNTPIGNIHQVERIRIDYEDEEKTWGELYIDTGYENRYIGLPEQSREAFSGNWYRTGDIVSVDAEGDIRVVGRKDDMVKINGNRVEMDAVAAICKKAFNLAEAIAMYREVMGRKAVVLYYVPSEDSTLDEAAGETLSARMPSYMIPYYYVKLNALPLLPNGKTDRKALPLPEIPATRKASDEQLTTLEKEICLAMRQVLQRDAVGGDDDFFEVGGDSLSGMALIEKLEQYSVNMQMILHGRTPKKIARAISGQHAENKDELEELYRQKGVLLTPFQTDMLDYQLYSPYNALINIPLLLRFNKEKIDINKLAGAVTALTEVHPVLRTKLCYEWDADCFLQKYDETVHFSPDIVETTEAALRQKLPKLDKPFKVFGELLYRFTIFVTEDNVYLFVDISHLINDGTSLGLLIDNLGKLYLGLPVKKDYYYYIMAKKQMTADAETCREDREYYERLFGDKEYVHSLRPTRQTMENTLRVIKYDIRETWQVLCRHIERAGISENVFIIALSLLTLYRCSGHADVMISWIYNGRKDRDIRNSVGEYITALPVGVTVSDTMTLLQLYAAIKEQLIGGIAHDAYSYVFHDHAIAEDDFIRVIDEGELCSITGREGFDFEAVDVDYENQAVDTMNVVKIIGGEIKELTFGFMASRFEEKCMRDFAAQGLSVFQTLIRQDVSQKDPLIIDIFSSDPFRNKEQ